MTTVDDLAKNAAVSAAKRLLETEAEILKMPKQLSGWFMDKPGHRDAFDLARYVLRMTPPSETPQRTAVLVCACGWHGIVEDLIIGPELAAYERRCPTCGRRWVRETEWTPQRDKP